MKILALSDIHENLDAVRKLRHQESNEFDAIVVAGDIGGDVADQFFDALSTFECPVLYVYGNWDGELEYDRSFGEQCAHLHMNMIEVGDIVFTGFSGCDTKWGQNPIALELLGAVDQKHKAVLDHHANKKAKAGAERDQKIEQVIKEYEGAASNLAAKSPDRRKARYLRQAERLEDRKEQATDELRDIYYQKIRPDKAYDRYKQEWWGAWKEALAHNKKALFDNIKSSGVNPERLVVVTHDRLTHFDENVSGIRCHLFGHRHGFKKSRFKGTHYVNVSALDPQQIFYPMNAFYDSEILPSGKASTYAIIEIDGPERFTAICKELK